MTSPLDSIIAPEIKNDLFYNALCFFSRQFPIKTVLEIGASSGEGSTEALALGIADNPHKPTIFTLEVSETRFHRLTANYANRANVKPYNVSSVDLTDFPTEETVINFYRDVDSSLRAYPLDTILDWLRQDIAYIKENEIPQNGINLVKSENNIERFDLVLIDGSEFTGHRELDLIYGANVIALDDINAFKNYDNHYRLLKDPGYDICLMNKFLRGGFSIFMRRK